MLISVVKKQQNWEGVLARSAGRNRDAKKYAVFGPQLQETNFPFKKIHPACLSNSVLPTKENQRRLDFFNFEIRLTHKAHRSAANPQDRPLATTRRRRGRTGAPFFARHKRTAKRAALASCRLASASAHSSKAALLPPVFPAQPFAALLRTMRLAQGPEMKRLAPLQPQRQTFPSPSPFVFFSCYFFISVRGRRAWPQEQGRLQECCIARLSRNRSRSMHAEAGTAARQQKPIFGPSGASCEFHATPHASTPQRTLPAAGGPGAKARWRHEGLRRPPPPTRQRWAPPEWSYSSTSAPPILLFALGLFLSKRFRFFTPPSLSKFFNRKFPTLTLSPWFFSLLRLH